MLAVEARLRLPYYLRQTPLSSGLPEQWKENEDCAPVAHGGSCPQVAWVSDVLENIAAPAGGVLVGVRQS